MIESEYSTWMKVNPSTYCDLSTVFHNKVVTMEIFPIYKILVEQKLFKIDSKCKSSYGNFKIECKFSFHILI